MIFLGSVVASLLVRLPRDQAVRVEAWPGTMLCCVLGQDTTLTMSFST